MRHADVGRLKGALAAARHRHEDRDLEFLDILHERFFELAGLFVAIARQKPELLRIAEQAEDMS